MREEEEEESENNKIKKITKQCSLMTLHENKSSSSWSDLGLDILREINKKLCYVDHIRFLGVCKSWRAVGEHDKRTGDVLPWLMELRLGYINGLSYQLHEPPSPHHPNQSNTTLISHTVNLGDDFNQYAVVQSVIYVDGWVYISVKSLESNISYFFILSFATEASFTLPQLDDSKHRKHRVYLALSATPDSPDCVFLALGVINDHTRMISVFRHGDTQWTTNESVGGWFGKPLVASAVFIRGVFYFLTTVGIGSYELATEVLKVDNYSTVFQFRQVHNFFGLDGDLMLTYIEEDSIDLCIRKYDWSNKVWVPLQSLGGRSLYLNHYSVYVDRINYYGISSANKIYVQEGMTSFVCIYSILEDGQLSSSGRVRIWGDPGANMQLGLWVDPPKNLFRIGKAF